VTPRRIWTSFAGVVVLGLVLGCGGARPPRSVLDADRISRSPAVRAARVDAPDAVDEAQRLLARARAAHEDGREELATLLGGEASARFDLAIVLARTAVAERRIAEAEREAGAARQERERHETGRAAEERRIAVLQSEAEARRVLEAERARAAQEENGRAKRLPASEQRLREEAMRAASAEARVRARMICLAGRALAADAAAFDASVAAARDGADRAARGNDPSAELAASLTYRDACVRALDGARAAVRSVEGAREAEEDALFAHAAQEGGLDPRRDERGVVLTLRRLFGAGSALAAGGRDTVTKVAGILRGREVRVVVEAHGAPEPVTAARAEAVATALAGAGVERVRIVAAGFGVTRPLLPTGARGRPDPRDERVEIVLVVGGS